MIETRYDIEYINPNETKKPTIGKFFAYALLAVSAIAFLAALTFSNLSKDNSKIVTKRIQTMVKPSTIEATQIETKSSTTKKLEKDLEHLSLENTQLRNVVNKQLQTTQSLEKTLEDKSKLIKQAEDKHKQLSLDIKKLSEENGSLTRQLGNITQSIKAPKTTDNIPTENSTTTPKKINSTVTIEKRKKDQEKVNLIENKIITSDKKTNNPNKVQTKVKSQMDKIIETMNATNNSSTK